MPQVHQPPTRYERSSIVNDGNEQEFLAGRKFFHHAVFIGWVVAVSEHGCYVEARDTALISLFPWRLFTESDEYQFGDYAKSYEK